MRFKEAELQARVTPNQQALLRPKEASGIIYCHDAITSSTAPLNPCGNLSPCSFSSARFSEVVGILENARVAEEGLELPLKHNGEVYVLSFGGVNMETTATR